MTKSVATQPGHHAGREPANKGQTYPAEVLTPEEVKQLLDGCSRKAPTGLRNRALIAVLYRSGLRISEALDLKPKDVNLDAQSVTVLHGKGDKARTVGLDVQACGMVREWISRRSKHGLNGRHPLFCTLLGDRVHGSYVRTLLPRLAKKAGIEKRVHAHGLRHTLASELAGEGIPMQVIQGQLGHGRLSTTEHYVRTLNPKAVVDAMKERNW